MRQGIRGNPFIISVHLVRPSAVLFSSSVPQPLEVEMFATIFLNRRKRRMPNGGIEELPFGQKHLAISAIIAGASTGSSSVPSVTSCSKNDDWHASLLLVPASPGWVNNLDPR
jgi:hypothetical protein